MDSILVSILGAVAGVVAGGLAVFLFFRKKQLQYSDILKNVGMSESKQGLIEKQAKEKEENIKKILALLDSRDRITNSDVESGLNISDATATRYLDELEKEGIIRQVGSDGRFVYYKKL